MPTSYEIENGQLKVTTTRPPKVRRISSAQLDQRIAGLNNRITVLDEQIIELLDQKSQSEAELAILLPFVGTF